MSFASLSLTSLPLWIGGWRESQAGRDYWGTAQQVLSWGAWDAGQGPRFWPLN